MFAFRNAMIVIPKTSIRRIDGVNWITIAVSSDVLWLWISVRKLLVFKSPISPARAAEVAIPRNVQQTGGIHSIQH